MGFVSGHAFRRAAEAFRIRAGFSRSPKLAPTAQPITSTRPLSMEQRASSRVGNAKNQPASSAKVCGRLCLNQQVKLKVAWIGKTKNPAIQSLTTDYLKRIARYADVEATPLPDEQSLLKLKIKTGTRPAHSLVIFDSRGQQFSSEQFAEFLQNYQDRNPQPLVLAVGPADGFSDQARQAAASVLSLGKMTLAHELARVVLLEQLYRAFTILKGHPYHSGH